MITIMKIIIQFVVILFVSYLSIAFLMFAILFCEFFGIEITDGRGSMLSLYLERVSRFLNWIDPAFSIYGTGPIGELELKEEPFEIGCENLTHPNYGIRFDSEGKFYQGEN